MGTMDNLAGMRSASRAAGLVTALTIALTAQPSRADEAGVSFWLPGLFGSLAAVPGAPGFGLATITYHTTVSAGGDRTFFRGGRFVAGLDADATISLVNPSYTFATPVLGGRFTLSAAAIVGHSHASIDASLTGPRGNTISGFFSDEILGIGDVLPMATLKWNQGVHNYMAYLTGDIPVGDYNPNRLANLGIGHATIDGGLGYTYFNPVTGHEFSVVAGLTYNFINPDTQYRNGVDFHLDWGASQFLSKQLLVGLVGYVYQEIGCDSGAGANLGCFRSRVFGVGPQIGYIIPMGEWQGYLNLKGYGEFGAENRPEGWNVWLTFAISPAAEPPPPVKPVSMIRK
jgi:hypothetical protein